MHAFARARMHTHTTRTRTHGGRLLEKDITKFLTAILIGTTSCTIYSAAMFTDMVAQYFGDKMVT